MELSVVRSYDVLLPESLVVGSRQLEVLSREYLVEAASQDHSVGYCPLEFLEHIPRPKLECLFVLCWLNSVASDTELIDLLENREDSSLRSSILVLYGSCN